MDRRGRHNHNAQQLCSCPMSTSLSPFPATLYLASSSISFELLAGFVPCTSFLSYPLLRGGGEQYVPIMFKNAVSIFVENSESWLQLKFHKDLSFLQHFTYIKFLTNIQCHVQTSCHGQTLLTNGVVDTRTVDLPPASSTPLVNFPQASSTLLVNFPQASSKPLVNFPSRHRHWLSIFHSRHRHRWLIFHQW